MRTANRSHRTPGKPSVHAVSGDGGNRTHALFPPSARAPKLVHLTLAARYTLCGQEVYGSQPSPVGRVCARCQHFARNRLITFQRTLGVGS